MRGPNIKPWWDVWSIDQQVLIIKPSPAISQPSSKQHTNNRLVAIILFIIEASKACSSGMKKTVLVIGGTGAQGVAVVKGP